MKKLILLSLLPLFVLRGALADEPAGPRYADVDGENDDWLYCPHHVNRCCSDDMHNVRPMDVFYLGPSVAWSKTGEEDFCGRQDQALDDELRKVWKSTAAGFARMANVYAPCYSQMTLDKELKLTNGCSRTEAASNLVSFLRDSIAYTDVVQAMDAYFTNFNPHVGRPFVLVGDGQGAVLTQLLMDQYFTNAVRRAYLGSLVACYTNSPVAEAPMDWDALPDDAARRFAGLRAKRTLTVDPNQEEAPQLKRFRSITNAVWYAHEHAIVGCTIEVAPGVYRESVSLPPDIGYSIVSTRPLGAVIDGEGRQRCAVMERGSEARASFHGFVFRNGYSNDGYGGGGVYNCDLHNSVVSNCVASGDGGGVIFGSLNQCLVVRNFCGGAGGGAAYTSLSACTVANNCATGTNRVGGVHNENYWTYTGLNSIVALNNPSNAVGLVDLTLARAIRVFADGDPRFVDPEHDDYRLRADSPCVDAGFGDFAYYDDDLDGNPRVLGVEADLGCFEHLHYAALPPGTLNVSSNAQVVGSAVYAQRSWSLSVEPADDWLSADVVNGTTNAILHFLVSENTTGQTRTGYVYLHDAADNVQTVRIDQVSRSFLASFANRKGVFVGVTEFAKRPSEKSDEDEEEEPGKPWQSTIKGCVEDSLFYRELWCGRNPGGRAALFTNSLATAASVSNAVERMIDDLEPDDEFMLSFSTHGGPSKGIWEASFYLHPLDELYMFDLMTNQLKRAAAKCSKVIVMVDACHSAAAYKLAEQMMSDAEVTETHGLPLFTRPRRMLAAKAQQTEPYAGVSNIAFVMAADYDEESLCASAPNPPHGEFTTGVERGFLDGSVSDADGDGYLDFHELYRCGRAYSEDMAHPIPDRRWQARCYNKNLLLETRMKKLDTVRLPKPYVPTSPYYFDFVNWLNAKDNDGIEPNMKPRDVETLATNILENVIGRRCTAWEAFVSLGDTYRPVLATNSPFKVAISLQTNGVPCVSCEPDLSQAVPRRTYTLYGKVDLTNAVWQVVTTNDLRGCRFFKAGVELWSFTNF